jgi:hypothetical protein
MAHRHSDNLPRDALTMLTEPDMQARYVAATLAVIEAELRKADSPAADRSALFTLVAGAARVARCLSSEIIGDPAKLGELRLSALPADSGKVLAFKRRK